MSARPRPGFLFGLVSLKSGPGKALYSSWSPYPSWHLSPLLINSPSQNQSFLGKDIRKVAEWEKNPSGCTWESVDSAPWGRGSRRERTPPPRNERPLSCGCGWLAVGKPGAAGPLAVVHSPSLWSTPWPVRKWSGDSSQGRHWKEMETVIRVWLSNWLF